MDIQLCDMFTTIVRSRKTKQTSHLPTWLVSVDFQQLQFLAFLSLTFSSLSFSKRKERVVNICYIIAKIYSTVPNCSQITPQWSHMVFVNDPDACTRHKTQRWRHIGSFFFLIKHIASISPWVISDIDHNDCWKKRGTKAQADKRVTNTLAIFDSFCGLQLNKYMSKWSVFSLSHYNKHITRGKKGWNWTHLFLFLWNLSF